MSPVAIITLVISALVVWGGLVASILFLVRKPERAHYPAGGYGADRIDGPVEHDT